MHPLQPIIEKAFAERGQLQADNVPTEVKQAIDQILNELDEGRIRVAERKLRIWTTHQWVKQAILLAFKIYENQITEAGFTKFYDKIPSKFSDYTPEKFKQSGVRSVPGSCVRKGAFVAPNVILMPSFVNIGAYVDAGTMVDTWASVGSCAQIGKQVHISGGAGIGGVLEPLQANPTIIEDNCFIGARSEIVEGVIVEEGSVISMGVFIGQSTPIYHRETKKITYGHVPAGSVVVPGTLPSNDGNYGRYAAIIVKEVDDKTRQKVSVNEILRTVSL